MICPECKEKKHKDCKKRNESKDYQDCDCLHREVTEGQIIVKQTNG